MTRSNVYFRHCVSRKRKLSRLPLQATCAFQSDNFVFLNQHVSSRLPRCRDKFQERTGLLLTRQYENALITARAYMWQYRLFGEESH